MLLLLAAVVGASIVHLWPGSLVPVTRIGGVGAAAGSLAGVAALARRPCPAPERAARPARPRPPRPAGEQ